MVATSHAAQKRVAVPKLLVQPTCLLLTERLMRGELGVGELWELVGADVSTVSRHLLILREAGVVACQKRGLQRLLQAGVRQFQRFP
jgi:DNA-binding transcriptional ArsR family regulator